MSLITGCIPLMGALYVVSAMTCIIYRDLASIPIAVDVIKCTMSECVWKDPNLEKLDPWRNDGFR